MTLLIRGRRPLDDDGSSPLVRVDLDDLILQAADRCDQYLGSDHGQGHLWHDCGGVWTLFRGKRVPGRTGEVFGGATCSRCGAYRDMVIRQGGKPYGGPVWPQRVVLG